MSIDEATEGNEEQVTAEPEVSEHDEEQDFLAGFDADVQAPAPEPEAKESAPPEPVDETPEPEPEPQPAESEPDAPDPLLELETRISNRMRQLEGHFGGLNSRLQEFMSHAKTTASGQGDSAPTQAQIKEASYSGEKLKALRDDFPEWAEAFDEQVSYFEGAMRSQLESEDFNRHVQNTAAEVAVRESQAAVQKVVVDYESRLLDQQFPGWRDTARSERFQNWLSGQSPEFQQKAQSNYASEAFEVLSSYQKSVDRQSSRRLEQAVAPTSGGAVHTPKISEEDEFLAAFNS